MKRRRRKKSRKEINLHRNMGRGGRRHRLNKIGCDLLFVEGGDKVHRSSPSTVPTLYVEMFHNKKLKKGT